MNPMSMEYQFQSSLKRFTPLSIAFGIILVIYLLVPMLIVIPASFTSGAFLQVPPDGFSWRWYAQVLDDQRWFRALAVSFQVSGIAAIVASIVGTLAAIALARSARAAKMFRPLFFLPMVLPYVVFALGLRQAGQAAGFQGSLVPLIVGQAVLCLPIAFLTVSSGLVNVDPALVRAARSMGASWWRTVWRIEIPLLKRSLVMGLILSFAFGFDEVVLALFLAPPGQSTLPAKLYNEATQNVSPLLASVAGYVIAITVLVVVVLFLVIRMVNRRSSQRLNQAKELS